MRPLFSQRNLFSIPQTVEITLRKDTEGIKNGFVIASIQGATTIPQKAVRLSGINATTVSISLTAAGRWGIYYFTNERGGFPYSVRAQIGSSSRTVRVIQQYSRYVIGEVTVTAPAPEPAPAPAPQGDTSPADTNNLPQSQQPTETMQKPANTSSTTAPAKNNKPRYRVISTANLGGSVTESVRELTPRQVASFRNRGFTVEQVGDSVPLHSAIVYRTNPRPATVGVMRRERNTRPVGNPPKPQYESIAGRRSRSHNRLVSQNPYTTYYSFRRLGQDGKVYDYIGHPQSTVDYFRNQNFNIYNLRNTSDQSRRTNVVIGSQASRWKKGKTVFKTGGFAGGGSSPGASSGSTSGGGSSPGASSDPTSEANRLEGELRTLTAQIREINERTSNQLVDLGKSTTDRDNQIQALDRWTQENLTRIDKTLLALGEAQKDASAGLTQTSESILAAVQSQIDALKATVESASNSGGASILGGLFNTSNLPVILILVVVLLVMIRK